MFGVDVVFVYDNANEFFDFLFIIVVVVNETPFQSSNSHPGTHPQHSSSNYDSNTDANVIANAHIRLLQLLMLLQLLFLAEYG